MEKVVTTFNKKRKTMFLIEYLKQLFCFHDQILISKEFIQPLIRFPVYYLSIMSKEEKRAGLGYTILHYECKKCCKKIKKEKFGNYLTTVESYKN